MKGRRKSILQGVSADMKGRRKSILQGVSADMKGRRIRIRKKGWPTQRPF